MIPYISIFAILSAFSNLFLAGMAVVIAGAVAYIAHRQYTLAKEKFKLDMFDKRFAVYKAAQRFLTVILLDGKVDLDKLSEYRRDTQDATFLFGQDIPQYLKRIDGLALELWETVSTYQGLPVGKERTRLCEKKTKVLQALIAELPNLRNVFAAYLRFDKWK